MANDYKRLKDEADIESVINALGIPVTVRGINKFIICPHPDHEDLHPTNCYFREGWNNVYCWACGRSINAIDLIMYTTGWDYGESADYLWEIEGKPDWYYAKKKKNHGFQISNKEMSIAGLHMPSRIMVPCECTNVKLPLEKGYSYDHAHIGKNGDEFLKLKSQPVTWSDFVTEKELKMLIACKCKEKLAELIRVEKIFRAIRKYLIDHGQKFKHPDKEILPISDVKALYQKVQNQAD